MPTILTVPSAIRRLLHPMRLRVARRQLARLRPQSVLFVCRGNLCRSPYAAGRLRRSLPPGLRAAVRIESAGFLAAGHLAPSNAVRVAERLDVDLQGHRSARLDVAQLRDADAIVVMEPVQRRAIVDTCGHAAAKTLLLGDFDPVPGEPRAISDPYGGSEEALLVCYRRINRCVAQVSGVLRYASRAEPSAEEHGADRAPAVGTLQHTGA